MVELMFAVLPAEGTHAHDKANITDDSSGHVAGRVPVELDTARTICSKQHAAILPAATRVEAAIVIGDQSSQRIRIIPEKRLTDFLTRFKQVFGGGQG